MSSSTPPSAFESMMSKARAKSTEAKNKRSTNTNNNNQPSPKKPKTLASPPPPLNPNSTTTDDKTKPILNNPSIIKSNKSAKLAELKSKIHLLKNKPTDFDPNSVASWGKGDKVPFVFLSLVFDMISNESGRIVITNITCNMLRTVIDTTPQDLVPVLYLAANRIAPAHEGLELGIGESIIIKALAEAYGKNETQIRKHNKTVGDLGLVAKESRSSQSMMLQPEPLTIAKVFETFKLIAKESGKDSQDKKKNRILSLLVAATDCEPQYLIRLLQAKLRIGLAEQTLLAALGQAAVYNEEHSKPPANVQSPLEEAAKIVKEVYSVLPVYDTLVASLLSEGVWNLLETCSFSPGVPIGPMLAKPTKGVAEIVNKFQDTVYTCEYKYDGERAQIHYLENGSVEIYSRNAERNTGKFPDVIEAISRLKKPMVKSFVLDCEIVAYDRKLKKLESFQKLSTRARKNVNISDIKVNVCIFPFDILYLNGQPLLREELQIRRERLYESFTEEPGFLQFATAITSNDLEEIQKFLDTAVSSCCEGLIIKTMDKDATYEPAKRSNNWLKLKKDYMEGMGDSLDLVPIAAFHGQGKRAGLYGAFLLACYDSSNEEYQTICKIGTGFTDSMLEQRSASLRSKVIPDPKPYYRFADSVNPDVWFEPTEVWEVKAADLTISPKNCAAIGIVDPHKGISLRFPRLLRVREDKSPEQATSSEQVAEMYNAQSHNQKTNHQKDDEDDY
ncbi:hypothetical protein ACFE04_005308 [Oxalis oulophora]